MKKKMTLLTMVIAVFIGYNVFFRNADSIALSKYGSKGDEVTQIQTKLKRWGYYNGVIDGIYGSKTLEAVKYFQRKNGLTQDGIARAKNFSCNGNNVLIK